MPKYSSALTREQTRALIENIKQRETKKPERLGAHGSNFPGLPECAGGQVCHV